jgi:hypothetical protein
LDFNAGKLYLRMQNILKCSLLALLNTIWLIMFNEVINLWQQNWGTFRKPLSGSEEHRTLFPGLWWRSSSDLSHSLWRSSSDGGYLPMEVIFRCRSFAGRGQLLIEVIPYGGHLLTKAIFWWRLSSTWPQLPLELISKWAFPPYVMQWLS